jgi:hypothetical protein
MFLTNARWFITGQTGDVHFEFIADRPVLDFLSTIAERGTRDAEKLRSAQDLTNWIEQTENRAWRDRVPGRASEVEGGANPRRGAPGDGGPSNPGTSAIRPHRTRRSVNGILVIDAVLLTTVPMVVIRRRPAQRRAEAAA